MQPAPWNPWLRFGFRFFFCYWIFWALPERGRVSLFSTIPGVSSAVDYAFAGPYTRAWHAIVQWTGAHVFHLSAEVLKYQLTGSGDTAKDWIAVFCYLVFSLAIACIWSVLDRRRTEYDTLHRWLRVLVRYTLAFTLLAYGGAKIVPLQFREPGFYYLLQPHGQASPMGVLWRFMGSSLPYTIFAGLAEAGSGLLLFFRRTTVLGALSSVAVMLNVVVLNFCYDVPVKLYSTHLLLMALFLLIPDLKRLLDVTLLNRPVPAIPAGRDRLALPRLSERRSWLAITVIKAVFLVVALGAWVNGCWEGYQETYGKPARPPLYGLYRVISLTRNGVPVQPGLSDLTRWQYIGFEFPGAIQCWRFDGTRVNYKIQMDERRSEFAIVNWPGAGSETPPPLGQIHFRKIAARDLELDGIWGGQTVGMQLDAMRSSDFLLTKRGFNWVQEFPFNR
jgi:hypothetical protein